MLEQIDAAGMTRFGVFQPDFPYESVLVGDVTGEFVHGFSQFLSPGAGERKTKQEGGQHVRLTSGCERHRRTGAINWGTIRFLFARLARRQAAAIWAA